MSYIPNPKTKDDFKQNVEFQIDNVKGWLSVDDYQCALIKAKCLVEALEAIVENVQDDAPEDHEYKEYEADQIWAAQKTPYEL